MLNAQFLPNTLKSLNVLLVLALVLDLLLDTLENPDGGRVVVDASASTKGALDHLGRRDEVVGEAVVETTLQFEQVLDASKEADVARVEGVE